IGGGVEDVVGGAVAAVCFPLRERDGRLDLVVDVVAQPDNLTMGFPLGDLGHRNHRQRPIQQPTVELGKILLCERGGGVHAATMSLTVRAWFVTLNFNAFCHGWLTSLDPCCATSMLISNGR